MNTRRTQILNDMGIEAWRLRRAAPAPGRSSATPEAAKARVPTKARAERRHRKQPAQHRPPAAVKRPEPMTGEPVGEPLTIVAFCAAGRNGGVLLATGRLSGRRQAMLANDIVHCLCGDWDAAVKRIEFNWPMPGVPGALEPALGAFLDKQIHDFAVKRILAAGPAAGRLPTGIEAIAIPDLGQFDDPDVKRRFWQQLQRP